MNLTTGQKIELALATRALKDKQRQADAQHFAASTEAWTAYVLRLAAIGLSPYDVTEKPENADPSL